MSWCVAYTAVTPAGYRERRRGEIRSHLWESEQMALAPAAVLVAAVRGAVPDVTWALSRLLPAVGRSFGTPAPYVVLAPLFPVEGWITSALTTGAVAHVGESVGALGGTGMLAVAGCVWLLRRRRRGS